MNKSQRFWLSLALLALLVPALLASAAVPEREVVAVDYLLASVECEALTAAPNETIQREVRLPVSFHSADGTSFYPNANIINWSLPYNSPICTATGLIV